MRDIIDRRGGTSTLADGASPSPAQISSSLSERNADPLNPWLAAGPTHSNLGPKVRKPTLDTRASKGRKLRYTPHDKIMNFMAPFKPEGSWHDEQVDELFGSLLGQRVQLGDDDDDDEMEDADGLAPDVGLGGLRMF